MDIFEGGPENEQADIPCYFAKSCFNMKKSYPGKAHQETVRYYRCNTTGHSGMADPPGSANIPYQQGEIAPAEKR